MTMKRYLITGEASAVRTLSDILCEPPYDWLVATDEGSSQRAILRMMEGLRAFQATTPECTIAYCFPDDPPSPSMVAAWEGQRWECQAYDDGWRYITFDDGRSVRHMSWPESLRMALEPL